VSCGSSAIPNEGFTRDNTMLLAIFFVIIVLWLGGIVMAYTLGGLIHLLLLVGVIILFIEYLERRKVI
jgi:Family of unknown function (DUF5670)